MIVTTMTVKEEENGPKLTCMVGYRVILTGDDRPSLSELDVEQREDESHEEYRTRKESKTKGERYDLFYLHDETGWVKCVTTTKSSIPDEQWETHEHWYPPHRVESVR